MATFDLNGDELEEEWMVEIQYGGASVVDFDFPDLPVSTEE